MTRVSVGETGAAEFEMSSFSLRWWQSAVKSELFDHSVATGAASKAVKREKEASRRTRARRSESA